LFTSIIAAAAAVTQTLRGHKFKSSKNNTPIIMTNVHYKNIQELFQSLTEGKIEFRIYQYCGDLFWKLE